VIAVSAQAFPPDRGGIELLMSGLAEALSETGPVRVFADARAGSKSFDADAPYEIHRFGGPKPVRRRLKGLAVARARPTAVFADSWKSVEHLRPVAGPVVVFAHGNEYPEDGRKAARIRRALRGATALVAVSSDTEARSRPMRPDALPCAVWSPPILPLAPPSDADLAEAESRWRDGPRLAAMARLTAWKGIDRAIEAVADLLPDHPGATLVVAGDGADRPRLEALARERGAADAVVFAGWLQGGRKTALLRTAELFLQPGRAVGAEREGYGLAYREAALEGLPSLSGRAGGAVEAVEDGETGLIVDGESPAAVSSALRRLVEDAALRARMSGACRRAGAAALWPARLPDLLAIAGLPRERAA